ncbi:MAG: HlyC/CorC family transporter [Gammaproteobacteria bacterium]
MPDVPIGALFAFLAVLIVVSALCSGAETAMMTLNRYRLRYLADQGRGGARRAQILLERPDRFIGLILLINNFANISASSVATVIALEVMGEPGIAIAAGALTLVILIFAEVAPKTLAALEPERVAFPAAYVIGPLLKLLYPIVWVVNLLANGVLRGLGIRPEEMEGMSLSREELRTVVQEAGAIPKRHQQMLRAILDLEKVTVEDVMVPRHEIVGINVDDEPVAIVEQLQISRRTRLPVYRGGLDQVVGILHARQIPRVIGMGEALDKEALEKHLAEPYFIPKGTGLHKQLAHFQRHKHRMGLVVDEYGDIQGLLTLEDILEEIVGEFTTDPQTLGREVSASADGSYLVDATASVRDLNRSLHWTLPTGGPKTLNGLILEALESMPERGTALRIADYTIEIVQISGRSVRTARIIPPPPAAP